MCLDPAEIEDGLKALKKVDGLIRSFSHKSKTTDKLDSECSTTLINKTSFKLVLADTHRSQTIGSDVKIDDNELIKQQKKNSSLYLISHPAKFEIPSQLQILQASGFLSNDINPNEKQAILARINASMFSSTWSYYYSFDDGFDSTVTYKFVPLNSYSKNSENGWEERVLSIKTAHYQYDNCIIQKDAQKNSSSTHDITEVDKPFLIYTSKNDQREFYPKWIDQKNILFRYRLDGKNRAVYLSCVGAIDAVFELTEESLD